MIARLVTWCTRNSWMVIATALVVAFVGELSRRSLSRDAVPDLSDPQIGIEVIWMGHPATEVATKVTQVLTDALRSTPGSTTLRGSSMSGMAYVDVVFGSTSDLGRGRHEIEERVAHCREKLPLDARVQIGPSASSTGWIFQYALTNPMVSGASPALAHFQDNVLRPALEAIPGVAEVAPVGEPVQELLVVAEPEQLRVRGDAFTDVVAALAPITHGNGPAIPLDHVLLPAATGRGPFARGGRRRRPRDEQHGHAARNRGPRRGPGNRRRYRGGEARRRSQGGHREPSNACSTRRGPSSRATSSW